MSLTEEDKEWIAAELEVRFARLQEWIHTRLMTPAERHQWEKDTETEEDREQHRLITEALKATGSGGLLK